MAIFQAYFDDSGGKGGACALAGYVAPAWKWANLGAKWQATLTRFGIDPPVFHMTDFENRKKAFAALPEGRRVALIAKLIDLIRDHVTIGVGQAASQLDCDASREALRRAKVPDFTDAYSYCLIGALERLATARKRRVLPAGAEIVCVFDYSQERAARIKRVFEKVVNQRHPGLFDAAMTFGNRHETVGIQAADILAYEVMKDFKNKYVDGASRPTRKAAIALSRTGVPLYGGHRSPGQIIDIVHEAFVRARDAQQQRKGTK